MYIKFVNRDEPIEGSVSVRGHVATLKLRNEVIVNTSGFRCYLDKEMTQNISGSSYLNFRTLYRNDEETAKYNGYQLSDNGSTYTTPEPEPYVPTLEEVQEAKVAEMNAAQQAVIQQGIDVQLSGGSEHFTLTDHDQASLMGLQTQVAAGLEQIPWHTSDETEHCKFYSNADMALITTAAMSWVTWHVTYFRDLRIYIRSLHTKEEVEAITYGMDIPEQYQSDVLKALILKKMQMEGGA